jgi:hypothetical protein
MGQESGKPGRYLGRPIRLSRTFGNCLAAFAGRSLGWLRGDALPVPLPKLPRMIGSKCIFKRPASSRVTHSPIMLRRNSGEVMRLGTIGPAALLAVVL